MFLCNKPSSETTDLDMLDGNNLRKRLRFRVKMMKDLRERFRKEYHGQSGQRHRQDPQSSNIQVGYIVLIDDLMEFVDVVISVFQDIIPLLSLE
ncbi:hypothetical protein TNCV_2934911 [Trichonephila clavipes]|nr:hypothetical protein TNCV_2934911 [Trichonephila clavipes]